MQPNQQNPQPAPEYVPQPVDAVPASPAPVAQSEPQAVLQAPEQPIPAAAPAPAPQPMPEAPQPQPPVVAPAPQPAPEESIAMPENAPVADSPTELPEVAPVTWQASEYLQHDKSPLWYVIFMAVVCAAIGTALYLQAWTFAVLIPVMAVALMVYTHRPPHVISYALSSKGIYVNDTLHPMGEFKSFSVAQSADPAQNQLVLIPVKRFRPSLTVYFPAEVGEALVDTVGAFLPDRPYKADAFDKIIQKLHI